MKGVAKPARSNIGRMIRAYRAVNDLSLIQLGNVLGISSATLMRIEAGRAMDAHTWLKIQNWLLR